MTRCVWFRLLVAALAVGHVACGRPSGRSPTGTTGGKNRTTGSKATKSTPPALTPARAVKVTRPEQLVPGPAATGIIGDFALDNGVISAVVTDAKQSEGFSMSGGNLVDLAARGGSDQLAIVFSFLDDTFPRQTLNDTVEIARDGDVAIVRSTGKDSQNPELRLVTDYRLGPGWQYLELRTTVTNTGKTPILQYDVGDVLSWGLATHFFPGKGLVFKGRITLPYLWGVAENASYGYAKKSGEFGGIHGSSWSDTVADTFDLAPGASRASTRYLAVTAVGDVASVHQVIAKLRGDRFATLTGVITDQVSGQPLPGADVSYDDEAGPAGTAITGKDGRFAAPVLPGSYRVVARAPGRTPVETTVAVPAGGQATAAIAMQPPSRVTFRVTEKGGLVPCKVTVRGKPPTIDPELGPVHHAKGSRNVALSSTGEGEVWLPSGSYTLSFSRGLEYTVATSDVTLTPGQTVPVEGALERVVDTVGYISADLHQHSRPSTDSSVSLDDRVTSNLAEGLEVLIATDHNTLTDYAPVIERMGAGDRLASIIGDEATTHQIGHFNAFPMAFRKGQLRNGAPPAEGRPIADIVADLRKHDSEPKVLQINHPRAGDVGYFDIIKYDPAAAAPPAGFVDDFDAIEIMNGKRAEDFPRSFVDWQSFLRRGRRITATAGSDSHTIWGQPVGFPRTFIRVADDSIAAVNAAALVSQLTVGRDVVASNGPFIRVTEQNVSAIGRELAPVKKGKKVSLTVEIQAAPWVDVTRLEVWHDEKLRETISIPASTTVLRLRRVIQIPVSRDGFVIFVAKGDRPLEPVAGTGAGTPLPLAVANPVFVRVSR